MTDRAEHLVLEAGKSEELRQAFLLVQEAQAPDGAPRYGGAACRALARVIVCRTYAGPLLELSHMMVAAASAVPDRRFETFFWGLDRATAAGFRGHFRALAPVHPTLEAKAEGVTILYRDGAFTVTYARMPLLAALLEFLITTLGYRDLDELASPLTRWPVTSAQVGEAANGLSRALYAFLKDHLPAAQAQRRNHAFLDHLAAAAGGAVTAEALTDDAILDYWRAQAAADDGDAAADTRTFSGVFQSALRLARLLRQAADRLAMDGAKPIGADRAAGEIDPEQIEELLTAVEEAGDLLAPLDEAPLNAVKFLNGRERDDLADLMAEPGVGRRFPLSVMRNAVFGRGQAKITQALRQGARGNRLADAIGAATAGDYRNRLETYGDLARHMERVLLATLRVLVEARLAESFDLALALEPGLDLTGLAGEGFADPDRDLSVVSLDAVRAAEAFFTEFEAGGGALAGLGARARDALKSLARQGFRAQDRTDPVVLDAFARAPAALFAVKAEIDDFLSRQSDARDWDTQCAHDRRIFADTFQTLYGAAHA